MIMTCIFIVFLIFLFSSNGWVDCWTTPYCSFTINYIYFPMPLLLSQSAEERGAHRSVSAPFLEEEVAYLNPAASRVCCYVFFLSFFF